MISRRNLEIFEDCWNLWGFRIFGRFPKLRKISKTSDDFRNFGRFLKLRKISDNSEDFWKLRKISETSEDFRNFENFLKLRDIFESNLFPFKCKQVKYFIFEFMNQAWKLRMTLSYCNTYARLHIQHYQSSRSFWRKKRAPQNFGKMRSTGHICKKIFYISYPDCEFQSGNP